MKIAITYAPWLLSHRGGLELEGYRNDGRGLSGSEMCAVRLYEELKEAGHQVFCCWQGAAGYEYRHGVGDLDAAIAVNCPDDLRGMKAKVKAAYCLLNDFTFCKVGFEDHVDLFVSPSEPHKQQCLEQPSWRQVEVSPQHPNGKAQWDPASKPWATVELGCDPERYTGFAKERGRVIYCSSPDRGLHWLLEQWPAIKRAVPHANLRIFYRLRDWIESMKAQCGPDGRVYPSVLPNVRRALFIDEALRRMADQKWDITVCDAVSRAQIEREMAEAQVVAYPLDPLNAFSEGFSCSTLESCAARACPITTDADAFKGLYGAVLPLTPRVGNWAPAWRDMVIRALTDEHFREEVNDRAESFARELTWKRTAEKLMAEIERRM